MKASKIPKWYNQRGWALVLALIALVTTYLIGSRALDTGSWQQYGLTFVCLVYGINRLFRSIWSKKAA